MATDSDASNSALVFQIVRLMCWLTSAWSFMPSSTNIMCFMWKLIST